MTLIDRLLKLSALWCAAQDRSMSRLATIVATSIDVKEAFAPAGVLRV